MTAIATIPVTCHACGAHFRTRPDNAGKRGSCPSCQAPVQVMSQAPVEEKLEAPAPPRSAPTWRPNGDEDGPKGGIEDISPNLLLAAFGALTALILGGIWVARSL